MEPDNIEYLQLLGSVYKAVNQYSRATEHLNENVAILKQYDLELRKKIAKYLAGIEEH